MKKVINMILPIIGILAFLLGFLLNLQMNSLLLKMLKGCTIIIFLIIVLKGYFVPFIIRKKMIINKLCLVYVIIFVVHLLLIPPFVDKYLGGDYDDDGRCSNTVKYNYFNEKKEGYYNEADYSDAHNNYRIYYFYLPIAKKIVQYNTLSKSFRTFDKVKYNGKSVKYKYYHSNTILKVRRFICLES